jgi:hypothetical protein
MPHFKKLNFLFLLCFVLSIPAKGAFFSQRTNATIVKQEGDVNHVQHGFIDSFNVPMKFHIGLSCALSLLINHNFKLFGNDPWIEIPLAVAIYGLPIFGLGKFIELSATELKDEKQQSISNPALTFSQMEKIRKLAVSNKQVETLLLYVGQYNLIDEVYAVGYETDELGEQKIWVEKQ